MDKHLSPPPVPPTAPHYSTTNHTFHLIMSVITVGCWLFVWPFVALGVNMNNSSKRKQYENKLTEYQQAYWEWEQYHAQNS